MGHPNITDCNLNRKWSMQQYRLQNNIYYLQETHLLEEHNK